MSWKKPIMLKILPITSVLMILIICSVVASKVTQWLLKSYILIKKKKDTECGLPHGIDLKLNDMQKNRLLTRRMWRAKVMA